MCPVDVLFLGLANFDPEPHMKRLPKLCDIYIIYIYIEEGE